MGKDMEESGHDIFKWYRGIREGTEENHETP
jgi:hypothetical protein